MTMFQIMKLYLQKQTANSKFKFKIYHQTIISKFSFKFKAQIHTYTYAGMEKF